MLRNYTHWMKIGRMMRAKQIPSIINESFILDNTNVAWKKERSTVSNALTNYL